MSIFITELIRGTMGAGESIFGYRMEAIEDLRDCWSYLGKFFDLVLFVFYSNSLLLVATLPITASF